MPIVVPFRITSRFGRSATALVVGSVLVTGCGSDEAAHDPFCDEAKAFQAYQTQLELVLFDPEETRVFFQGSVERIASLAEGAPVTVKDDVEVVRDGFVVLDAALADVGYNVLLAADEAFETAETDAASDRIDEYLAAACRSEGDPITGFADDPFAPEVLSIDEVRSLEAQVDGESDDLAVVIASELAAEFGLTESASRCVVDHLDVSLIAALAGGDPITDEASASFAVALEQCGVDLESVEP